MSRAALLAAFVTVLACSKKDDASSNAPIAEAPPGMNLAGTWSVQVMPETQDTTLLMFLLNATNQSKGWKMTLPNREPMEVRVLSMSNDSIVFENGPFASALVPGVQVRTHSTVHLQGDTLVGRTIAHYDVKGPDSVRILRTIGTRQ
jgi:hypothetical protein